MTQTYYYSSNALDTTLTTAVNNALGTIVVGATTGFPGSTPYTLIIDAGLSTQEVVSVTSVAGTILSVTRGFDGSTAQAHSTGASVKHGVSAQEFANANVHQNATSGVHGVSGSLNSAIADKLSTSAGGTVSAATTFALPSGAGGTVGTTIAGFKITLVDANDLFTQIGRVDIPADPSSGGTRTTGNGAKGIGAGAPDTFGFYFNGSITGYFNEYGEMRAQAARTSTVAFRVKAKSGGSTSQILQDWYGPGGTSVANITGGGDLTVNSVTAPAITSTGTIAGASVTSNSKTVATIQETVNAQTPSASYTIPDVTTATMHSITLTASRTLTLPTAAAGKSFSILLIQNSTGGPFTVTWTGTIKWAGGSAPTLTTTASKADEVVFRCYDGTNWVGSLAGNNL